MAERSLVCISCPIGCRLLVREEIGGIISVSGNSCARGEVYGREEMLAPKRVVTATVLTDSRSARRLPVKTAAPLPKELIGSLLAELYRMRIALPVRSGEVLLRNVGGSGVDVVATRSTD